MVGFKTGETDESDVESKGMYVSFIGEYVRLCLQNNSIVGKLIFTDHAETHLQPL